MNETQRSRARALACEGKRTRQIASHLGVTPLEVFEAIGESGEGAQFARMADMALGGATYAEIGRAFGITRQAVGKTLGPSPRRRRTRSVVRKVRVEPETYDRIRELAAAMNLRSGRGPQPRGGSVGLLLDAIARGELAVYRFGRE